MNEQGENGGRGQSLLAFGESVDEPGSQGRSRLAEAIAQVRAERGLDEPRMAARPSPATRANTAPRISPLLEALAAEPTNPAPAALRTAVPVPAESWPRERSTGAIPPLLAAAGQWPERKPAGPVVAEPLPIPAAQTQPEPIGDAPPASPVEAAATAVRTIGEARMKAPPMASAEREPRDPPQAKLPFPEPEPVSVAQPGDAFWDDAARVLGLEDAPAQNVAPRGPDAGSRQGRASTPRAGIGGLVASLRHSFGLILATTLAGALLGGGMALLTPRTYSSTAELLADGRGMSTNETDAKTPAIPDAALGVMVENQLRILRSQSLLAEVSNRLSLADDPEFDGTAEGLSLSALAEILAGAPGNTDPQRRKVIAAQTLERNLNIVRDGGSFVINVTATTRNPEKSALIANTVADTFLSGAGQDVSKGAVRVLGNASSPPENSVSGVTGATRIISRAMPALSSNPPSRLSTMFKGLALGLFLGVGLAVLRIVRRRLVAAQPQEDVAPVPMPQPYSGAAPALAQAPATPTPEPMRPIAAAQTSTATSTTPFSHPTLPEDTTMQRAPYRRGFEAETARSAGPAYHQDRYRPSPYRQAPMQPPPAAHEPQPWVQPAQAWVAASEQPRMAPPAYPYWREPVQAPQPQQQWREAPPPYHPGQQHMVHPHQYSQHVSAPTMPPQGWAYPPAALAPEYGGYGAPAHGQDQRGMSAHAPHYRDHAQPAHAAYEPPRQPEEHWREPPREPDQGAIEEIRATLRECRDAIRDLSDRRTRRRYF